MFDGATIKTCLCLLLAGMLVTGCRTPRAPANPKANARTQTVLKYFQGLETRSDKRLLSGQFSNFGNRANLNLLDEIHERTGHWPAILGVDYAGRGGVFTKAADKAAIEYWKAGGLVTVSAHLYNPARRTTDAFGGLRDKDVDINSLLNPGTETHLRWMHELDQVAAGLEELQANGVVVLWRPFHEMNGGWFWWGDKDPATFKKHWHQMFDYFTKTKGLDNLLWVYAPNHGTNAAKYYPGYRYVDLVGLDAYTDFVDTNHIFGYAQVARLPKPFGFTEFGPHGPQNPLGDYDYLRFLHGVQKNFQRTLFFMSWNAKWSLAANSNVTEMLNSPWIVNRGDLPKGLAGSQ